MTNTSITFRDFAAAIMQKDVQTAGAHLELLLGLDAAPANAAAAHFARQMEERGQPFMMKSMGMRNAVMSGSDDDIGELLSDCFGIAQDAARVPTAKLRAQFGS